MALMTVFLLTMERFCEIILYGECVSAAALKLFDGMNSFHMSYDTRVAGSKTHVIFRVIELVRSDGLTRFDLVTAAGYG